MRAYRLPVTAAILIPLAAASLASTPPIIYPAKGQTPQQQQKDEGECAAWAKQSTGIDPAVVAATPAPATPAAQPQDTAPKGERVRGAARGAAAGAVVGEIANNDADEGAAAGAAVGAVAAGSRSRREGREKQQAAAAEQKAAQEQAEAKKQEQMATYNRANAACLEGRGYVIK